MAKSTAVMLRLKSDRYEALKRQADKMGIPVATLLQIWIAERLDTQKEGSTKTR